MQGELHPRARQGENAEKVDHMEENGHATKPLYGEEDTCRVIHSTQAT